VWLVRYDFVGSWYTLNYTVLFYFVLLLLFFVVSLYTLNCTVLFNVVLFFGLILFSLHYIRMNAHFVGRHAVEHLYP
jgi:hypothetical protein